MAHRGTVTNIVGPDLAVRFTLLPSAYRFCIIGGYSLPLLGHITHWRDKDSRSSGRVIPLRRRSSVPPSTMSYPSLEEQDSLRPWLGLKSAKSQQAIARHGAQHSSDEHPPIWHEQRTCFYSPILTDFKSHSYHICLYLVTFNHTSQQPSKGKVTYR